MSSTTTSTEPADSAASVAATRRHTSLHVLMLAATFCWASNIVAGKEALSGIGPLPLAQLRSAGAGLVLLLIFRAWRARPALHFSRREGLFLLVLSLTGVLLNQLLFVFGLHRTSVAHAGLIVALGPVMVLFLSCLLRLEALTVLKFSGMVVSFGGVAILAVGRGAQGGGAHWQGDLIVLGSSASFACYTILVKEISGHYDALTLNALVFGMAALLLTPLGVPAVLHVPWSAISATVWCSLVYMIIFGSVVPYTIFAFVLTELAASRVAAFNYLQPVIASALAMWLLAERMTAAALVGGALILLGVYLAERERGEADALEDRGLRV